MAPLRLFLCGDVMTGRGIDQIMPHPSDPAIHEAHMRSATGYVRLAEAVSGPIPRGVEPAYIWGEALALLEQARPDARIMNLETAITTSGVPEPKGINYRMHPANVSCLVAARSDCCVLANNHVLDWGSVGLLETLSVLRKAGIGCVGAGRDADAATAPMRIALRTGGGVLVFGLAATDSGVPRHWAAGPATPGVNLVTDLNVATAARVVELAQRWREPGDILVASVHWGGNWGYAIPSAHRAFARALIDGGFALVHGHSSHHPKAIETYRGRLVLYGCGDFVNDYEGIAGYEAFRGDLVLMYLAELDGTSGQLQRLEMVPMRLRRFRLERAGPADAAWLGAAIARESAKLDTRVLTRANGNLAIEMGAD